jgi:internalin A
MNRHIVLNSIRDAVARGGRELTLNLRPREGTLPAHGKQAELRLLDIDVIEPAEMMDEIIAQLPALERLSIRGGQIEVLLSRIPELTSLHSLTIGGGQLQEVDSGIFRLTELQHLDLSHNQLRDVPDGIVKLTHLQHLDLSHNQLKEVPDEITNLTNLKYLNLQGNRLAIAPEILKLTDRPEEILNAIIQLATGVKRSLNEAKMILVGEGAVGKTSLVKSLVNEGYNPDERKTEGLEIRTWKIVCDHEEIKLNLWDFGGQEIYHATHQFFLTKRSLYFLVIDARQDEFRNRIEYWLRLIRSLAADSPTIVVINKCEEHKMDLDRRGLETKYQIAAFIETSCATGKGIEDLKNAVTEVISKLDHVHDLLPDAWFRVKSRLERMRRDFITYDEYEQICQEENVRDELSRKTLIGYLHDLGVVLNFQDDDRLRDTNVLNPKWVTEGVYQLLTSYKVAQDKGHLSLKQMEKLLEPEKFPRNRHRFIIEMMEKFELCFEFPDTPEHYLIPGHLQKEEPDLNWNYDNCLAFEYHYETLPGSIISRFIVRMNEFVSRKTYWRTGVVLKHESNKALVKADLEDRKIFIYVTGKEQTRRSFLTVIRSHFDTIHKSIAKIEAKEKVPIPGYPSVIADYQHLMNLENAGLKEWIPEGITKPISVKVVLDGIEAEDKRSERAEDRAEETALNEKIGSRKAIKVGNSSWRSGSFYIAAFVILLSAMVGAAILVTNYVSLQAGITLSLILIASLLAVGIVGALQLRHDDKFSDDNFLQLMVEAFKRLPLLRG